MIFKFFSVLFLVSILLFALKHKTKSKLVLAFAFLLVLAFSFSPVTDYLITQIQPESPKSEVFLAEKNVIVVLGGGSFFWPDQKNLSVNTQAYSRLVKALQIYQDCKKAQKPVCQILISGGDPQLRGRSEFELMAEELKNLGVVSEDIVKEDRSRNTKENAFYSSELIRNGGFDKVILVTSGFHSLRAERWFLHFKISAQVVPSDTIAATQKVWPSSINLFYSDLVIHELLGLIQIQIENYIN